MIDHIKIKGCSTDSGKRLSEYYKAGTTWYEDHGIDGDTFKEFNNETCIVKFKAKRAWCRFYEKIDKVTGELKTDYNIWGSLHRVYRGKSWTDFHYSDVPEALKYMCKECAFNADKPHRIMGIEIGVNLKMDCDPDDYLTIFKLFWGGGFHEMRVLSGEDRPHGIERVMSDMYRIKIYNKTIYGKRVQKQSPVENLLRLEVQFMARAIDEYKLPTTIQGLCDKEQFQRYVDKFCLIIKDIKLADWAYNVDGIKGLNLRNYYLIHGNIRAYQEFQRKIKGDRKAVELEKARYDKLNAALAGRQTLKEEFEQKFDAKVRKLMR